MKRRQTTTTDYFSTIFRGGEEINLGPYNDKGQAVASAKRYSKPGDKFVVEKIWYTFNNGARSLVKSVKITEVVCQ